MARVTNCIYCGGSLLNSDWHQECRLIEAEDILLLIENGIVSGKIKGVSMNILDRILEKGWKTKKEAGQKRQKQQERARTKEWWEGEKERFLIRAEKKWEARNPDPDPTMFRSLG